MRSSSIKSLVVTLTLTATVLAAIPAEAKPRVAPRATVTATQPGQQLGIVWDRIARLLRRIGGVISQAEPSIPLPSPENGGSK